MKKIIIAVVVLVLLAGISIGAFLSVKSKSENEEKKKAEILADNVLFDVKNESINKIQIFHEDGSYTAEYIDNNWTLTDSSESENFSLNQVKFQGIASSICNLTADVSYGEANDENKGKYGLSNPYKVVFSDGESEYTLYIGDKSPTGDYYYAYTDTKNNIYAIPATDAEAILSTSLSIQNDKFISCDSYDIAEMILKRDGEIVYDLTLNTENNLWQLPKEYELLNVNQTRPSSIITLITRLTAEEMFEQNDDDIAKYGFDNPVAEFTVKLKDGTERNYLMSKYGQNSHTYTYVYLKETKQVETYYASDMGFIDYNLFDFIMQMIENANMYAVSEFEISCDGLEDKFTVNTAEDYAECRGNSLDLANAQIKSLFETFYNTFSYTEIIDIDIKSKPDIEDSIFTAKYTKIDGTEVQLDLVPTGETGRCFVFSDKKYTGTITNSGFINSMLDSYAVLCRQAGFDTNN